MRSVSFDLPAIAGIVPADVVATALRSAGKQAKRVRKLPEMVLFWLVVGMGLHRDLSIPNVLDRLAAALGSAVRWGPAERPHPTSIAKAFDRLGWETVRTIFRLLALAFYERFGAADRRWGLRVLTIDGTTFRTADTKKNEAWFGRPASNRGGPSAFPQIQAVMLVGAFSHLIAHVALGPYSRKEQTLAADMVKSGWIHSGMLILVDRLYYSFVWAARLLEAGAHFLARAQTGTRVTKRKRLCRLGRNDWLCELRNNGRKNQRGFPETIRVREITRTRRGFRPITVVTSLLDPVQYPADEIFKLYGDRWEAEQAYREIKCPLADAKVPFRCKTPQRTLLEAYGLFIAFNCIRALMCQAADQVGVPPIRISFTDALDRVRRALMWRRPDDDWERLQDELVTLISLCVLPPRRERSCPRALKSLFVRYPRKKKDGTTGRTRHQSQRARKEEARKARKVAS